MSIYNLYNNLVDSGKYSMVPSSNYQQNLENNIKQNYSGVNYFRNSTSEMAKDYINRAETPTGKALMNYAMAAGAVPVGAASFPYDAYQALNRYDKAPAPEIGLDSIVPENMYRGKTNFIDTYKKEQPIKAAYNRAMGMVDPLAESLGQELANFNLKNTLSNMFSTKANASELPSERRQASSPRAAGAEFIPEEEKGIFSLGDILADLGRKGVEGFKDVAGRSIASQALGGVGTMAGGPVVGGIAALAGLLTGGDMFNSPYIGAGAATVDEYGNMYSAEQLDQMNARGGYYTDPARASRRRDAGIINMIERRNKGLSYGKNRLAQELAKQAKEEAARQSAANAMQDSNRAAGTGGYQAGYSDDFMEGPDPSASNQDLTSTMGSS